MLAYLRRNRFVLVILCVIAPLGFLVIKQQQRHTAAVQIETILNTMTPLLMEKVEELKRKLNDVEFLSKTRSRELVSLRRQLAKIIPANESSSSLNPPGIYGLLPHLNSQPDALTPSLEVSQGRTGVSLAFGIPSIGRATKSYLIETIESMLRGLSEEDKNDVVIIVFLGDTSPAKVKERAEELKAKFTDPIRSGVLEIIAPPASFYPDMKNLPRTFGDPLERVQWRTKQNLDYAFLMMYAQSKARFYIQMEDDIIASPSYASIIRAFAMQQDASQWFMLEFSALGFIGKLFRTTDLGMLVDFFLMFYKDKPIDWLLDHILWVKVCNPEKDAKHCQSEKSKLRIKFKPSLFQHVGKESSLKGKKQSLIDKDFKQQPLFQAHLNPRAEVKSTFETYQGFSPEKAYLGQGFFWGLTPHPGEVIRFCFKSPVNIERFKFKTGNLEHPGDILNDAIIEVLTSEAKTKADKEKASKTREVASNDIVNSESRIKDEYKQEDYIEVGKFGQTGTAEGNVPGNIGQVAEIRIRVVKHEKENWIILNEIHIVPRKKR